MIVGIGVDVCDVSRLDAALRRTHGMAERHGRFRRQGRGHLIVTSSIVGKRGVPYTGAYAATKFAQMGLVESLRSELVGTDIHVSALLPVSTATEFFVRHMMNGPCLR